jgi:hypothetical protein
VGIRIAPIARSAVGDLYQQRVAKPAQLRTHSDRLIIGMRGDDHDLAFDRPALENVLQARSGDGAGTHPRLTRRRANSAAMFGSRTLQILPRRAAGSCGAEGGHDALA